MSTNRMWRGCGSRQKPLWQANNSTLLQHRGKGLEMIPVGPSALTQLNFWCSIPCLTIRAVGS